MAGAKRRNPVFGPLLTFGLMIVSVAAVAAIAHFVDSREKSAEPSNAAVASDAAHQVTRQ